MSDRLEKHAAEWAKIEEGLRRERLREKVLIGGFVALISAVMISIFVLLYLTGVSVGAW